ncbi:MAG: hypothetical protein E5X67_17635 [Mesorhizobium sp.]|uniref:hypothetical protein n=1 Tax=Mesorhizobium sp. TaxID=1871066 RepID=UPI00121D40F5|nr:hypothetical protein [Mesorhizobium sp.]TIP27036.1 MAG: hypothetical protein E5X67_17635 [Mesorhizobium sp.]
MFNLIVRNTDWKTGRANMIAGRALAYTSDGLKQQFQPEGNLALDDLAKLPCLFMQEGIRNEEAYVGHITRHQMTPKGVTFDFTLDRHIGPLPNFALYELRSALGIDDDFEFHHTHWAVKDEDLLHVVLRMYASRRSRPNVFALADFANVDHCLVSAMMPFAKDFSDVYDTIREAAKTFRMNCQRADEIFENRSVMQDIVNLIDSSRVVVCDLSGRNPNVFYEAGIAHALGKEVILITQRLDDIPFDLRHIRNIVYDNHAEGRKELTKKLIATMETVLSR